MKVKEKVRVMLKSGVHDPQGETVLGALKHLGFGGVGDVRVGKYVELVLQAGSKEEANTQVKQMCDKLLSNPIIESYQFEIS